MSMTSIPVCVIGGGTMGRGIAQVALAAGHSVSLVDPQTTQLASAKEEIATRLARRAPAIAAELSDRLHTFTSINGVPPQADTLVIEAILESLDAKTAVFRDAANHFGAQCILATNTSSLSVTAIAAGTPAPDRVVGMHFFNPVPAMRLVEVVTGLQTDPAVADLIAELAKAWGKEVARVRSAPGFIVNRVARGFYGEALRLVEEQVADPVTIDEIIRGAGGFKMGPFELMDLIGNDVNSAVTRSVWTAYNFDPRFEPSRIQDELVAAGRYGRKTGHGFYSYDEDAAPEPPIRAEASVAPEGVEMVGACAQLETILQRSGLPVTQVEGLVGGTARVALPGGSIVLVTRGRTARAESSAFAGRPVVVLDRCLSPSTVTTLAVASNDGESLRSVVALLERAGISAMEVADTPGLVLARTLALIANEAWETSLHGVATADDIDTAMRLGTNYPCGPFEWTSRWGADTVEAVLDALWQTYHDPRYRVSRALRDASTTRVPGSSGS